MTGTHQSTFSLNLPLQSNTLMSAVFMSLSARPNNAKEKEMAVWSVGILTRVMPSPPATFTSMQEYAGEWRQWRQLMKLEIWGPLWT